MFAGRNSQLGVLTCVFVFVSQGYGKGSVLRVVVHLFLHCYLSHREASAMASLQLRVLLDPLKVRFLFSRRF